MAPVEVYVNVAEVEVVGFAGADVIVGVGGELAANAVHAAQLPIARTPSSARGIHALALFAVVVRRLIMVVVRASRLGGVGVTQVSGVGGPPQTPPRPQPVV